jgi:protein-L-isoaspartate(D-aspartate) O-methyltransferase
MHNPTVSAVRDLSRPGLRRETWLALFLASGLAGLVLLVWLTVGQPPRSGEMTEPAIQPEAPAAAKPKTEESPRFVHLRQQMVREQLRSRDISDERVLAVMERVPRHRFVPDTALEQAYDDHPLPIGHGQTISQPYIVALMTQLVQPKPTARALDVGTGSGYQAAVLCELCKEVYSIEIVDALAQQARHRLVDLGYRNVEVRSGDGYRGWPEHAPFDLIVVAAAPDHVPQPLVDQLAVGGRLVIPVGKYFQDLLVIEKQADGKTRQWKACPVAFVPMTGEAQNH